MGKTNKDNRLVKRRHLIKDWNQREVELGFRAEKKTDPAPTENPLMGQHVNPELYRYKKSHTELSYKCMDGWKEDRSHSAAHRHSAAKTKKRCKRMDKRSAKQDAQKEIQEEL